MCGQSDPRVPLAEHIRLSETRKLGYNKARAHHPPGTRYKVRPSHDHPAGQELGPGGLRHRGQS